MKKQILIKLRVHREIIRTLDETRRATVVGGVTNCGATNMNSGCSLTGFAPPRKD
jgi:hypothetical protein